MGMKFRVTYEDGTVVEPIAKPKDYVAFERQYNASFTAFAADGQARMEWLYYMAWSPLHRTRQDTRTFDEFLDAVDEIEAIDEEPAVEAAPFETTPSDESSPGLPSEPA